MTSLPVFRPRGAPVVRRMLEKLHAGRRFTVEDDVVVEEPLEIRLGKESVVVTMRTPGDDFDLALGFLFSEGVISSIGEVADVAHAEDAGPNAGNVVTVTPRAGSQLTAERAKRVIRASSSCGLCGKETIAQVRQRVPAMSDGTRVALSMIVGLPDALRAAQPVFAATGGLHAVGLFAPDGAPVAVKEDVGRHNAVDKIIGDCLRAGDRSLAGHVMMFSGRAGFEIVQKAAVAGVQIVCSVSAPSSLAVDLAREVGMTLIGFVRGGSVNVYSRDDRVIL